MPAVTDEKKEKEREGRRDNAISAIIRLSGCAVNGITPDTDTIGLSGFDSENFHILHDLSASLSLNSIIYTALEGTSGFDIPQTPLFETWKDERDQEVYKSIMFDRAWEKLRLFLEENGIWHLLLKGLPMKEFYPEPGMRQMADVDVLFDVAFEERVRDYFTEQGYEMESYGQGNADSYLKPPFYNFELHRVLFTLQNGEAWHEYYKDVKDRLIPDECSSYGYHFTDEDFYIYSTVHAFKHYHSSGTGLRSLLDCYVYLKAKGESLDWDYIHREINSLSLNDFELSCRDLCTRLFSEPLNFSMDELTEEERGFLIDFLSFGTYGTISNMVWNKLREMEPDEDTPSLKTRARYLWRRLFPDMDTFKEYYPFFYEHRWLMPVGYVYRLIYKGITSREKMSAELHALRSCK